MPDARSLPGLGIFQLARLGRSGSEPLESSLALSGALHRSALGNAFFAAFDREREGSTPAIWANPEATTPVPPVGILPLGDEALIQPAAHYVLFERDSHLSVSFREPLGTFRRTRVSGSMRLKRRSRNRWAAMCDCRFPPYTASAKWPL